MLIAEKLTKEYGGAQRKVEAVSNVDFQINDGEFIAIVGRSGSGKSTLLAMLGGLCRPTAGKISIAEKVGFVFQFASLLPSLRVLDNVALPALIEGKLPQKEAYARARALLEEVGLGARYDFYPNELSGGEQRRVAIARALINSPEILLADEPTADLDEETEEEILSLLIDLHRAFKLTLVVVTHNQKIASRADRIFQMRAGKLVGETAPAPSENTLASADESERVRRIFEKPAAAPPIKLGDGFERFVGRLVLLVVPFIAFLWCVNFGISHFETQAITAQEDARRSLEELALSGLRAEVKDITFAPEKNSYDVAVYLRNTTGAQPIYVLSPVVRGFVQIGSTWREVPLRAVNSSAAKVLKITGEQIYHFILSPDVEEYAQLLPYYMHVRLSNEMLVSPSSQPKNDLIERADNYYVYLKPQDADDSAIAKKLKFPGKPPVWIPMPPH